MALEVLAGLKNGELVCQTMENAALVTLLFIFMQLHCKYRYCRKMLSSVCLSFVGVAGVVGGDCRDKMADGLINIL